MLREGDGFRVVMNPPIVPDRTRPKREEIRLETHGQERQATRGLVEPVLREFAPRNQVPAAELLDLLLDEFESCVDPHLIVVNIVYM